MINKLFIKPKLLITIALIFSAILIAVTSLDIYFSYKDIYRTKSDEAAALLTSVQTAGENAYLSGSEVENLIIDKLLDNAYLISGLEKEGTLSQKELNSISSINNVDHIYLFSSNGNLESSNTNIPYSDLNINANYGKEIDSIRSGKYDYYIDAEAEDMEGASHLLAIHKRETKPGGIIVLSIESSSLADFRKRIGIGSLFQKITNNRDIQYVIVQDPAGIIIAGGNIENFEPFSYDAFISKVVYEDTVLSRELNFPDGKVYEAAAPFKAGGESFGVIRVGLSLALIDDLIRRTIVRTIITSSLLLLVGLTLLIYLARTQSYITLKNQYKVIQSYTGNILENMSDAVIALDRNGRITLVNKAAEALFGTHAENIIEKHYESLFTAQNNIISEALNAKTSINYFERKLELANGKNIIGGGSVSIVKNENDGIETIVAVLRDVTALKEFEEEKKRNEKLKAMGELAGSVAHEIKNPLNLIGITAQRFEKEFAPESDKEEYFQLIKSMRREVNRAADIINQFLQFARPPKIQKMEANIRNLIGNIKLSFESAAVKSNINFTCECDDLTAKLDSGQISRALINLIQNAFDAVENNGTVSLKAYKHEANLNIEIADTGTGIKQADINKIFDIYFTTKPSGSGLGLSMVNQIIAAHSGVIKVKSEIGKGTTFTIELPVK